MTASEYYPAPHSMDWFWFRPPSNGSGFYVDSLYTTLQHIYLSCGTYGVRNVQEYPLHCWCCGKFVGKAKVPMV